MFISEKTQKLLNLKLTSKSIGCSLLSDCVFFETTRKNVYLTDYDLNYNGDDGTDANIFKSKGLFCLFGESERMLISRLMLDNIVFLNNEIQRIK